MHALGNAGFVFAGLWRCIKLKQQPESEVLFGGVIEDTHYPRGFGRAVCGAVFIKTWQLIYTRPQAYMSLRKDNAGKGLWLSS